jgi:hypothetical protein
MNTTNIFEQASRLALRFDSPKGKLTVEDLWNLPLKSVSKDKANLDAIAIELHEQVKKTSDVVSFVTPLVDTQKDNEVQLKLDIVKYVISVKLIERDQAAQAADRSAKRQRLLEVLERKENAELESKSAEEIRALINSL